MNMVVDMILFHVVMQLSQPAWVFLQRISIRSPVKKLILIGAIAANSTFKPSMVDGQRTQIPVGPQTQPRIVPPNPGINARGHGPQVGSELTNGIKAIGAPIQLPLGGLPAPRPPGTESNVQHHPQVGGIIDGKIGMVHHKYIV